MVLITAVEIVTEEDDHEEVFDFSSPEHVLIKVINLGEDRTGFHHGDWKRHQIESCTIIWRKNENVSGAASYEASYGGFLDYTIEGMTDCPGEGWFVIENITGFYSHGDGWMTDDDMEFYFEKIRPATEEEIKLA